LLARTPGHAGADLDFLVIERELIGEHFEDAFAERV
jgi:hypothetical protein